MTRRNNRTLDHSILVLDGATDARGIYVPMTRGRHVNEAFVTVQPEDTLAETLEAALQRGWIDRPAITHLAAQTRPGALGQVTFETWLKSSPQQRTRSVRSRTT